jgi:uncharacterized membrane protein YccC
VCLGRVDPRDAFARYEQVLRPLVTRAQQLPPGAPKIAHPRTRLQVSAFRTAVRVAASPLLGRASGLASGYLSPPAEAITLPEYPIPAAAG